MATIDSTLVEIDSITMNANIVKDLVLGQLLIDKLITPEQASDYQTKWQVIVIKKSWFKSWVDKFGKKDIDAYVYKYVKFEN